MEEKLTDKTQDTEDVVALDMTPTGAFKLPRWQYQLRAAAACLEADPPLTREFRKSVSDMLGRHQTAIQSLSDRIDELTRALEPFANLADANMNDPLSKWLTVAHIQNARAALHQEGIAAHGSA